MVEVEHMAACSPCNPSKAAACHPLAASFPHPPFSQEP